MGTTTKTQRLLEASRQVQLEPDVALRVSSAYMAQVGVRNSTDKLIRTLTGPTGRVSWGSGDVRLVSSVPEAPDEVIWHTLFTGLRMPPSVTIDLGNLPTRVAPEVAPILAKIPIPELGALLGAVKEWLGQNEAVRAIDVRVEQEPESPSWTEVVFELKVAVQEEAALALWDSLAAVIDEVKATFGPDVRRFVNRHMGFHVLWGDEGV